MVADQESGLDKGETSQAVIGLIGGFEVGKRVREGSEKKKYPLILSDTERDESKRLIATGTALARKLTVGDGQPQHPHPGVAI